MARPKYNREYRDKLHKRLATLLTEGASREKMLIVLHHEGFVNPGGSPIDYAQMSAQISALRKRGTPVKIIYKKPDVDVLTVDRLLPHPDVDDGFDGFDRVVTPDKLGPGSITVGRNNRLDVTAMTLLHSDMPPTSIVDTLRLLYPDVGMAGAL